MKVYTNRTFEGYWPVGSGAVVVADNPKQAASLLNRKLEEMNLRGNVKPEEMVEVSTEKPLVRILVDGNY